MVFERVRETARTPGVENVPLDSSLGRVLARDMHADRDYPPFNRSARDGFAVISSDVANAPATLELLGETRAGEPSLFSLQPGQTVEIMTGAPGPENSDAVVMVEYSEQSGNSVTLRRSIAPGRNLIPAGSEVRHGERVLEAGARIGYPTIALLGTVGCAEVPVYRRPEVAILSTGDEVLPVDARPQSYQIRKFERPLPRSPSQPQGRRPSHSPGCQGPARRNAPPYRGRHRLRPPAAFGRRLDGQA